MDGDHLAALEDDRRRRLIEELVDRDGAEAVSATEAVHDGEEDLEALRIELFHKHLPLLERSDVVEWDRESFDVRKGPDFDQVRTVLATIDGHADGLPDA